MMPPKFGKHGRRAGWVKFMTRRLKYYVALVVNCNFKFCGCYLYSNMDFCYVRSQESVHLHAVRICFLLIEYFFNCMHQYFYVGHMRQKVWNLVLWTVHFCCMLLFCTFCWKASFSSLHKRNGFTATMIHKSDFCQRNAYCSDCCKIVSETVYCDSHTVGLRNKYMLHTISLPNTHMHTHRRIHTQMHLHAQVQTHMHITSRTPACMSEAYWSSCMHKLVYSCLCSSVHLCEHSAIDTCFPQDHMHQ